MSLRREKNRKQRKATWIRARNYMHMYPDCNYGDFYCHHYLEGREDDGPVWTDFRFFHSKLKRYFAVSMVTATYEAYNKAEDRAFDEAHEQYPFDVRSIDDLFVPSTEFTGLFEMRPMTEIERRRHNLLDSLREKYLELEYVIIPRIEICDYGAVVVGVHATVNKSKIDEHVIREFITRFRELGEPITPGWKQEDEAIKITPQDLRRFSRTKAVKS